MRHSQQKLHSFHSIYGDLVKKATFAAKVTLLTQILWQLGKNCDIRSTSYIPFTVSLATW
jgi:hypothetical protein